MAGTFRTSSCRNISLWLIQRLSWVLLGCMIVLVGALSLWPEPIYYPEVIVPAARIIEREVPSGPPTVVERIRYVYVDAYVRAVAPGAVVEDVARFCRPVLIAQDRTEPHVPTPSLIRTVSYSPSGIPLRKGSLLVTSMDGHGDLVAEDFRVRAPFGIAAGLEDPYRTVVRYPRWAPLHEVARGALWYLTFRTAEAIFIK